MMDTDTLQALISEVRTEKESPDAFHILNSMTRGDLNVIIAWLTMRQQGDQLAALPPRRAWDSAP